MNSNFDNTDEKKAQLDICTNTKKLLKQFYKKSLLVYPTPLHRLENLERFVGHKPIWIKRDDMTGIGIGGNKIRNLEYLLGDAIEKNYDTVICSGHIQSNLVSLTAAAARNAQLECISVHNDKQPKKLEGNALLNHIFGAKTIYISDVDVNERNKKVEEVSIDLTKKGYKPYIIHNGASTPVGMLGYIEAAIELYEQCLENNIKIKHVFVPAGNGGVASGFIYGTGLLGAPFHVYVISVEHPKNILYKILTDFLDELSTLVGKKLEQKIDEIMTINDEFMGEGWSISTEDSDNMIFEFAQLEGILLEKVYTSKTVVGMVNILKNKSIPKNEDVCFIHTGGLGSLFAQF